MKLYKKIAILMLCAVMVFSFAACNPGEGIPFLSTKSKTTLPDNTVTVTFPEGYTIVQIAQSWSKAKFVRLRRFSRPARSLLLELSLTMRTTEFFSWRDIFSLILTKFILSPMLGLSLTNLLKTTIPKLPTK